MIWLVGCYATPFDCFCGFVISHGLVLEFVVLRLGFCVGGVGCFVLLTIALGGVTCVYCLLFVVS